MAVVTPTERPKSVHNRCVNELFVALFVLSLCPFDISVSAGAIGIGLSQISSFLSQYNSTQLKSFVTGLYLISLAECIRIYAGVNILYSCCFKSPNNSIMFLR